MYPLVAWDTMLYESYSVSHTYFEHVFPFSLFSVIVVVVAQATRLADELRTEQEHSVQVEKFRKSLEIQIKDMQVRLDEAEAAALKGGRRTIEKLEARVSPHVTSTLSRAQISHMIRLITLII